MPVETVLERPQEGRLVIVGPHCEAKVHSHPIPQRYVIVGPKAIHRCIPRIGLPRIARNRAVTEQRGDRPPKS
jgi:hypothetical protein